MIEVLNPKEDVFLNIIVDLLNLLENEHIGKGDAFLHSSFEEYGIDLGRYIKADKDKFRREVIHGLIF